MRLPSWFVVSWYATIAALLLLTLAAAAVDPLLMLWTLAPAFALTLLGEALGLRSDSEDEG